MKVIFHFLSINKNSTNSSPFLLTKVCTDLNPIFLYSVIALELNEATLNLRHWVHIYVEQMPIKRCEFILLNSDFKLLKYVYSEHTLLGHHLHYFIIMSTYKPSKRAHAQLYMDS